MNVNDLATVLEENAILRRECGRIAAKCDQAREERDAAIRERDKARREACQRTAENLSLLGSNVRLSTLRVEHAARRGWDCFKSDHIGEVTDMPSKETP